MKSFTRFIAEKALESSEFYKVSPRWHGYYIGVGFAIEPARTWQNQGLTSHSAYDLDRSDGWFRKNEGVGGGYGLMLRDVRLSGKKMSSDVNGIAIYPVNVTYLPNEFDEDDPSNYKKSQMTMYINTNIDSSVTPQDVINYVKKNGKTWVP